MKFFADEKENKHEFDNQVETEFQLWLLHQNQRIVKAWPQFVDRYLRKLGNLTACRIAFRYRAKCGDID